MKMFKVITCHLWASQLKFDTSSFVFLSDDDEIFVITIITTCFVFTEFCFHFFFFFLCTHLQITLNLKFSRRIFQITSIFPIEEIFDIVNVKFSQNRNRTIAISKFHVLGNKKNLSAETNAQKNFCIKSQRETLTRIVTTPRNNVPSRNYPYRVIDLTTLRTNCDPGLLFERNVSPGLPYTLITA